MCSTRFSGPSLFGLAIGPMFQKRLHTCLLYLLHRSSVVSSRPGPKPDDTPLLFVEVHLDANDDTATSSTSQATPVAALYLSQISMNAKRLSPLARSGLVSLHSKYGFLSNAPLPTHNADKLPPLDSYCGLNRALTDARPKNILSAADKLTYKRSSPRSSGRYLLGPGLRTNHFSTRCMWELERD